MSLRPRIPQEQVITNGDMSAASITSTVTILGGCSVGSYQFNWSGTSPVGTIAIQISNDYSVFPNGVVNNAGNWIAIYFNVNGGATPVNSIPVSGNTGAGIASFSDRVYAIRAVYTKGSGTGTLQGFLCAGVV